MRSKASIWGEDKFCFKKFVFEEFDGHLGGHTGQLERQVCISYRAQDWHVNVGLGRVDKRVDRVDNGTRTEAWTKHTDIKQNWEAVAREEWNEKQDSVESQKWKGGEMPHGTVKSKVGDWK